MVCQRLTLLKGHVPLQEEACTGTVYCKVTTLYLLAGNDAIKQKIKTLTEEQMKPCNFLLVNV